LTETATDPTGRPHRLRRPQKARIRDKARGQLSPLAIIEAVERSLTLSTDAAFDAEREAFITLRDSEQSAALRHIFFAERAVSRIRGDQRRRPPSLDHLGVLGGGTMGAGIAAACLLAGLSVTIVERDDQRAGIARTRVLGILDDSAKRGLLDGRRAKGRSALTVATNFGPAGRMPPDHRGGVRGHGREEGRLRRA
jgi:3-hydroxyacyl-CoA dehydrogenase